MITSDYAGWSGPFDGGCLRFRQPRRTPQSRPLAGLLGHQRPMRKPAFAVVRRPALHGNGTHDETVALTVGVEELADHHAVRADPAGIGESRSGRIQGRKHAMPLYK